MEEVENIVLQSINPTFGLILKCIMGKLETKELEKKLPKGTLDINSVKPYSILHLLAGANKCPEILLVIEKHLKYSLFQSLDDSGSTPLRVAILMGTLGNAEALVTLQKSFLEKMNYNNEAIDEEITKTVNIGNNVGNTPLHVAAQIHDIEKLKFLLTLGADTTAKDCEGYTPLDCAASSTLSEQNKKASILTLIEGMNKLYKKPNAAKSFVKRVEVIKKPENSYVEQERTRESNRTGWSCAIS